MRHAPPTLKVYEFTRPRGDGQDDLPCHPAFRERIKSVMDDIVKQPAGKDDLAYEVFAKLPEEITNDVRFLPSAKGPVAFCRYIEKRKLRGV